MTSSEKACRIEREINRERDGKYGHGMEAMCVCGHRKGHHVAGGHECIEHEDPTLHSGAMGEPCSCEKFRKDRSASKVRA
jgi:hypothetical protein